MQLHSSDDLRIDQLTIHLGSSDEAVFASIFKRYYITLCIFAERMVGAENAKDVIEELFVSLWNKANQLEDEEHLKAFLYHAAKNACLSFLRSDFRLNQRNTIYAKGMTEIEESYLMEVTRTELIKELYLAIAKLPNQCSKIMHMGYVEGLRNTEIAEKLGLSIQTVKNQKMRGIGLLKKSFRGDFLFVLLLLINQTE